MEVPVIDISPILEDSGERSKTAKALHDACRSFGFFYIVGHGLDMVLQKELERLSKLFFDLPEVVKLEIAMQKGGKAWRGFFPVGREFTSGKPDLKEGIYFGKELGISHPTVQAGWPMHGPNLFPESVPGFREVVLAYIHAMTQLGHGIMRGMALSLGLPDSYFKEHFMSDPLILFRIFHYPAQSDYVDLDAPWGVGEHTDYGVLTILKQDETGGLQIKTEGKWIQAPFLPNSFICNIGDMLDRMTGGYYRSTPHRVKNTSSKSRFSYPFFFDPNFEAEVRPIPFSQRAENPENYEHRWDGADLQAFEGTYGSYLLNKVKKVFPELNQQINLDR